MERCQDNVRHLGLVSSVIAERKDQKRDLDERDQTSQISIIAMFRQYMEVLTGTLFYHSGSFQRKTDRTEVLDPETAAVLQQAGLTGVADICSDYRGHTDEKNSQKIFPWRVMRCLRYGSFDLCYYNAGSDMQDPSPSGSEGPGFCRTVSARIF